MGDSTPNTDSDLEELPGVGPATADNLRDAGLDTIEAVATADTDVLADTFSDVPGFSDDKIEDVQADAVSLAGDISDDHVDEVVEEADELVDALDEPETATAGPERHQVDLEATGEVWLHTVKAVLDEALRMRQRNHFEDEQALYRIATELMAELAFPFDDGQLETGATITAGFEASRSEMNDVHQALSAGIANYRGKGGINALYGDLQLVRDQLDETRAELQA